MRIASKLVRAAVLALALLGSACSPRRDAVATGAVTIDAADYKAWSSARTWRSREELLQFFADREAEFRARGSVAFTGDAIAAMADDMSTMFPLGNCRALAYHDGRVRMDFDGWPAIPITGAYGQAHLTLSSTVEIEVHPPGEGDDRYRFTVASGTIVLSFSLAARLMGPAWLHDVELHELSYRIDPDQHRSSISTVERIERHPDGTILVDGSLAREPDEMDRVLDAWTNAERDPLTCRETFLFDIENRQLQAVEMQWILAEGPTLPPHP
jgi:hypothetical protein